MLDERGTGWAICTARDLVRPGLPVGGVPACADAANVVFAALTPGVSNCWIRGSALHSFWRRVGTPWGFVALRNWRCRGRSQEPVAPESARAAGHFSGRGLGIGALSIARSRGIERTVDLELLHAREQAEELFGQGVVIQA